MASIKTKVINKIIEVEGGYVNDPNDSGGETNYGITKETARKFGYHGPMAALDRHEAFRIYETVFWNRMRLDDIAKLSESIAEEVADTAVNMGKRRAGLFLQRALNAFNRQQKDYRDLTEDGIIGNQTLVALTLYLQKRGPKGELVLFRALNCLQGAFYIELSQSRPKDESFVFGWFLNRVA